MGALKRTTEDYAEQIAEERYGCYSGELTPEQQTEVWERAGERVQQELEHRLEMEADRRLLSCPKCGTPLNYFSGLEHIPAYLYCPKCNDTAYAEDGSTIALLQ